MSFNSWFYVWVVDGSPTQSIKGITDVAGTYALGYFCLYYSRQCVLFIASLVTFVTYTYSNYVCYFYYMPNPLEFGTCPCWSWLCVRVSDVNILNMWHKCCQPKIIKNGYCHKVDTQPLLLDLPSKLQDCFTNSGPPQNNNAYVFGN